jgi:hypothetical protein
MGFATNEEFGERSKYVASNHGIFQTHTEHVHFHRRKDQLLDQGPKGSNVHLGTRRSSVETVADCVRSFF